MIFSLAVMSVCESRISLSDYEINTGITWDYAFDRACDAAAVRLRSAGEELTYEVILEAEKQFCDSLAGYFGTGVSGPGAIRLTEKIPVIFITCEEGYFIGYLSEHDGKYNRI